MSVITLAPEQTQTQKKKVIISLGQKPAELKLTPQEVTLNPGQSQEVLWQFNGKHDGELIIQFAPPQDPKTFVSPFRGSHFRCPQDGGYLSGRPSASKARAQAYEYTVTLTTSAGVRAGVGTVIVSSTAAGSSSESATEPAFTGKTDARSGSASGEYKPAGGGKRFRK